MAQNLSGWFYVLPSVFASIGLGVAYVGSKSLSGARAAGNWPRVEGTIIDSRLDTQLHRGGRQSRKRVYYLPAIRYRFSVAGTEYRSSCVKLNLSSSTSPKRSNEIVSRFAPGSTVDVHYDPADPTRSVLIATVTIDDYFILLAGLAFCVGGAVLAFAAVMTG